MRQAQIINIVRKLARESLVSIKTHVKLRLIYELSNKLDTNFNK